MSQNYNKNLDFLTPETLALVVLIHEVSLDFDQAAEPSSPLINRILANFCFFPIIFIFIMILALLFFRKQSES